MRATWHQPATRTQPAARKRHMEVRTLHPALHGFKMRIRAAGDVHTVIGDAEHLPGQHAPHPAAQLPVRLFRRQTDRPAHCGRLRGEPRDLPISTVCDVVPLVTLCHTAVVVFDSSQHLSLTLLEVIAGRTCLRVPIFSDNLTSTVAGADPSRVHRWRRLP